MLVPCAIGIVVLAQFLATAAAGFAQDSPLRLPSIVEHEPTAQPSTAQLGTVQLTTAQFGGEKYGSEKHAAAAPDSQYWQVLPEGLIYRSYLAGAKEPRMGCQWVYDHKQRWLWEVTLGGRVGLFRYGNDDPLHPQGWQMDLEGAAFPRLDMQKHPNADHTNDLLSADFRVGLLATYGWGRWQRKCGYYHISSHLGDELMLRDPNFRRINYSRDSIVFGQSYYWTDDLRLYGEVACAISPSGGALPWEFQFGVDYSPAKPSGPRPQPFAAINAHLREEVNFGGNLVAQAGLQWRGTTGHLFRAGMHYFNGMSDQFEFFDQYESKIGLGIWYDY
jgi:hypothetical protein